MHIWYEYHDETYKMRIKLNMQTLKRGVKKIPLPIGHNTNLIVTFIAHVCN